MDLAAVVLPSLGAYDKTSVVFAAEMIVEADGTVAAEGVERLVAADIGSAGVRQDECTLVGALVDLD